MSKENGDFLGEVGGFWNQALSKVGDVAQKFADDQIEMAKKNAPPQRRTYEEKRDAYARMGDEGEILKEFRRSSSDGRSSPSVSSTSEDSKTSIELTGEVLKELSNKSRINVQGPLNSPPKTSGESKENQGKSKSYIPDFIKKSYSYCRSCLINPLTFERNTSKNFQEDVKTEYKKENNKNPEVKRQDGATKESQTSSSSASVFGSFRERLSNAWRAGVDIKVGVTVTSNGRSQEYSTESELRPLSTYEAKEMAISAANTVIGAAGSSYQAMKKAKENTLGTAKELAVLLNDGSNSTAPSTSFGDLGVSAARAMGSLSKTKISSPDLPTVSQVRALLPDLPTARQIRGSLPSLPAASQVKASLPSFPTTKGMKELAASLRPAEGTFKNMQGSLPSMPRLPSLPSFRSEIGISFGGSGR